MKIGMLGLNYEAVVVGTWLGQSGFQVSFWEGDSDFSYSCLHSEKGLGELLSHQHTNAQITYTRSIENAVAQKTLCFLPFSADCSDSNALQRWELNRTIECAAQHMELNSTLVLIGAVPLGTYTCVRELLEQHQREDVCLVVHPTFFRRGHALSDISEPKRVILGSDTPKASRSIQHLYSRILPHATSFNVVRPHAAELARFAAHAQKAVEISFLNELAGLCEQMKVQFEDVFYSMQAAHSVHDRLPAVDWTSQDLSIVTGALELLRSGKSLASTMDVLHAAKEVDTRAPKRLIRQLRQLLGRIQGKRIAIWGLTQNSTSHSLKGSFSCTLIRAILAAGGEVVAYDPVARVQARKMFRNCAVRVVEEPYEALKDADVLLIGAQRKMFKHIDHAKMLQAMRSPTVIDGCRLLSSEQEDTYAPLTLTSGGSSEVWTQPIQYLSDESPTQVDLAAVPSFQTQENLDALDFETQPLSRFSTLYPSAHELMAIKEKFTA